MIENGGEGLGGRGGGLKLDGRRLGAPGESLIRVS